MSLLSEIKAPTVIKRTISHRRVADACRGESARMAVGKLEPGCEIYGFTKGQFSLIHLLDTIIEQVGDADVVICTWSAADGDVEKAKQWIDAGSVKSLRMIVDFSFQVRKPDVCQVLRERFGDDALRVTVCHAKFVLIRAGDWHLVIRTSMNLTHNPRFENFEISDCPAMYQFMETIVNEVWETKNDGDSFDQHAGHNRRDWKNTFKPSCALPAKDSRDLL